jgi:hypothetical protein
MKIAQNTKVSIVFTVQKCKSNIVVEFGDSLYDHVKKILGKPFCGHNSLRKQRYAGFFIVAQTL